MVDTCSSLTSKNKPCKGRALPGRPYCLAHDPEAAERRREGNRRGGEARSNARRAAKQWAAVGEQVSPEQLPAMLRALMLSVKAGTVEPAQAQAIAALAKASLSVATAIELDERIATLEEAVNRAADPPNIRRLAS